MRNEEEIYNDYLRNTGWKEDAEKFVRDLERLAKIEMAKSNPIVRVITKELPKVKCRKNNIDYSMDFGRDVLSVCLSLN